MRPVVHQAFGTSEVARSGRSSRLGPASPLAEVQPDPLLTGGRVEHPPFQRPQRSAEVHHSHGGRGTRGPPHSCLWTASPVSAIHLPSPGGWSR